MRKSKEITECEKSIVRYDVDTTQCEDGTIKCEKKIKEPPYVAKYSHLWCWYCAMWRWYHQMWEKNKGTTECDKNTVTCHVGTAQYEADTIKCEEKK